jgi:hypothetical protein
MSWDVQPGGMLALGAGELVGGGVAPPLGTGVGTSVGPGAPLAAGAAVGPRVQPGDATGVQAAIVAAAGPQRADALRVGRGDTVRERPVGL